MKVGVYFDLRNPPQWRRDPAELYASFLELCEEAEHVGLDSIWVTEHHGFDDDYLPAPLTLLAAVAARTRRVRLGTAVVVAPLHAAAAIAEQSAVVDLLSAGRLDLGLGAGYRGPEFDLFGAEMASRYRVNDARAREIRNLWASGAVTPAPAQQRVPIWMGYLGPKGARRAGRMGENLLSIDARNWPHYRAGLLDGGHDPAVGAMGGAVQGWVSDDPERDWHMGDEVRHHASRGVDEVIDAGVSERPACPESVWIHRLRSGKAGAHPSMPPVRVRLRREHAGRPNTPAMRPSRISISGQDYRA